MYLSAIIVVLLILVYMVNIAYEYSRVYAIEFTKSMVDIKPSDLLQLIDNDPNSNNPAYLSYVNSQPGIYLFKAFATSFGNDEIRTRHVDQ